jgi:uncharacterized protein (DUF433 family)
MPEIVDVLPPLREPNKNKFKNKQMKYIDRITINPDICHGKPSIRGLRYPVENMLELLASGMSIEDILNDYEDLEKEDLLACLEFATKLTQVKSIYKIAS